MWVVMVILERLQKRVAKKYLSNCESCFGSRNIAILLGLLVSSGSFSKLCIKYKGLEIKPLMILIEIL